MSGTEAQITDITRLDVLDLLLDRARMDGEPLWGTQDILAFLGVTWPLETMPSADPRFENLEEDIVQHFIRNDDWTLQELFTNRLGLLSVADGMFMSFVASCLHPRTRKNRVHVEAAVTGLNKLLIHDGYVLDIQKTISNRPVYVGARTAESSEVSGYEYDIALSFAGAQRQYAHQVADYLKGHGAKVFYDLDEEAALWGKNLAEHLEEVYTLRARYCLMFVSKDYAERVWPTHERRSALERALRDKEEYILPIRFDATKVPGLSSHVAYQEAKSKTPEQIGRLALQKIGLPVEDEKNSGLNPSDRSTLPSDEVEYLVEDLETSLSFAATRPLLTRLWGMSPRLSAEQLRRVVSAFNGNSQVRDCYRSVETYLRVFEETEGVRAAARTEWVVLYVHLSQDGAQPGVKRLQVLIRRSFPEAVAAAAAAKEQEEAERKQWEAQYADFDDE